MIPDSFWRFLVWLAVLADRYQLDRIPLTTMELGIAAVISFLGIGR